MSDEKSRLREAWNRAPREWRDKQEIEFAAGLLDPELWIETGDKILRAADLVRPALDRWWSLVWTNPPPSKDSVAGEYVADVYYMLLGFAAENYLKAGLVRKKPEIFKQSLANSATLPDELNTHNLGGMAEELEILMAADETWLLEILQARAVWAGRYPFPAKPSDSAFGTGVDSRDSVEKARALVLRLRGRATDLA